jgi:predicted nucleotidyltransferase
VLARHGGALSAPLIAHHSGLSRSSVWLALQSLEELHVVAVEGSGNVKLYRLNGDYFLAAAIRQLFEAEQARFAAALEAVRSSPSSQRQWVRSLWLYGSVARREDRPGSDLDIGVIADAAHLAGTVAEIRTNLRSPAERIGFLPSVVGLDFDDVERLTRDRDPWWESVTRDAIVLLGGHPADTDFERGEEASNGTNGADREEGRKLR